MSEKKMMSVIEAVLFAMGESVELSKLNHVLEIPTEQIRALIAKMNDNYTKEDRGIHIVELEEGTRKDNARFFTSLNEVPTHAITMGIANIMNAKKILVVANGANKAKAVYQMIKGEVNENCPASILQKHNDVVVVVDEEAYSLCK